MDPAADARQKKPVINPSPSVVLTGIMRVFSGGRVTLAPVCQEAIVGHRGLEVPYVHEVWSLGI